MKRVLLTVSALSMSHLLVASEIYELRKSFTFGYNFNSSDAWSSGKPAEAGNGYLVSNGYSMQVGYGTTGREIVFNFPGDSLQIGEVGGSSGVFCHAGAGDITIPKFILANGYYYSYYSWSYRGPSKMSGSAVVLSSDSMPFSIKPVSVSDNHQGLDWYMTITGVVGTGLSIEGHDEPVAGRMNIHSSSPGYMGSIRASKPNLTIGIATSDSLGGVLPEFNERAFVLAEQATLESLNAGIELKASAKRGIYVESSGGRINTPSGKDLTVGWPISGEGVLVKCGAGALHLSNAVTVASLSVAEGALAAAPGTTVAISKVVLNGGVLGAGVGCGVLAPSVIEVANGGRIFVRLLGNADIGTVIPFLVAKKGTLVKDDFYVCAGIGMYGAPFAKVISVEDGEYETFSLVSVPVVETAGEGDGGIFNALEGSHWEDGNPVNSEAAYLLEASTFTKTFTVDNSVHDYVFPGQSLTLAGADGFLAKLTVSSETFKGNLRLYNYSRFAFGCNRPVFKGNMEVNTTEIGERGLMITVNADVVATIESVVSGSGWMYFNNYSAADTVGTIEFTGINTYTGGMYLYGNNKFVCLRISDERNLGANPPTMNERALYLDKGAVLHPRGSVTIDDSNRGIFFNGENRVVTDEGETTSILSPAYANYPVLTVSGGGTFAVGGTSINRVNNSEASIVVEDGFVKAKSARIFDYVKFTFGNGTGLAVDLVTDAADARSQYGTILTNAETTFSSSPLQLRIDHEGDLPTYDKPVPVMTIPEALAEALGDNVEFVDNLERGKWRLVRDSVTMDGKSFVRYSARYEKGFAIILR